MYTITILYYTFIVFILYFKWTTNNRCDVVQFSSVVSIQISVWYQWRSEGPANAGGGAARLKGPARSLPERSSRRNLLAREAQTSSLRGGAKIVATPLFDTRVSLRRCDLINRLMFFSPLKIVLLHNTVNYLQAWIISIIIV